MSAEGLIRLAVIATDASRAAIAIRRLEGLGFTCDRLGPDGPGQRLGAAPAPDVVVAVESPGTWQPASLLAGRDLLAGAALPSAAGLTMPPLFVLSEGVSPARRAEAIAAPDSRIWDWVESDCSDREIAARIGRLARLGRLIAETAEAERRAAALETVDRLTGLPSHSAFQDHLAREHRRAERYGRSLCLILVDIDRFRSFNESHGHRAGDRLLQEMAIGIKATLRGIDMVARYAGGVFAILLPETDAAAGLAVAERARLFVEERGRTVAAGSAEGGDPSEGARITASVGVAHVPSDLAATRGAFLAAAEGAVRRAKDQGRNRVAAAGDPRAATARQGAAGAGAPWSS